MILTGPEIARLVEKTQGMRRGELPNDGNPLPTIFIEPFDPNLAGSNSYDMHLSPEMRVYALASVRRAHPELFDGIRTLSGVLPDGVDARADNPTVSFTIPEDGFWMKPGVLYLGATVERTHCEALVPWLDGRSSTGRMGLSVHVTAGRGDDDWPGRWTLEMTCVAHPVRVYPNMRCLQVTYFQLFGERKPYQGRYRDQDGPTASRFHLGESR